MSIPDRPLLCGFLKVRDEIIQSGNLYRVLANLERFCEVIVICDDASCDGTREHLLRWLDEPDPPHGHGCCIQSNALPDRVQALQTLRSGTGAWRVSASCRRWLLLVPPEQADFWRELFWKQEMLLAVHLIRPRWVYWADADEVLEREALEPNSATASPFRELVAALDERNTAPVAYSFHYTQGWRVTDWARTDAGFDGGWFLKLWRYRPELAFEVKDGTHHAQFPQPIGNELVEDPRRVVRVDAEVFHYGNVGVNLRWKAIKYWGGLGGVKRHLDFDERATYRPVPAALLPLEAERVPGPLPRPFTTLERARIRRLENLRARPGLFAVVIPTWNRAFELGRALASLLHQTDQDWIALVLDDGSIDDTPERMREWQERDPRIFYCQYLEHRGGVAVNELGMQMACAYAEYWTRLGSDDWWFPRKLELDRAAFEHAASSLPVPDAVYGPFVVARCGEFGEVCGPPQDPREVREQLLAGVYRVGWACAAIRTRVLQAIRMRYGSFVPPELQNMEDFVLNARLVRLGYHWVWHGLVEGRHVVDPSLEERARLATRAPDPQAVWTDATVGPDGLSASANGPVTAKDHALSLEIIARENEG